MRKKIFFVIIAILLVIIPNTYVLGKDLGLGDLGSYKGSNPNSVTLVTKANNILGIIQIVGTVISVVMLIAIGIKYMVGSVEEKAEYKKSLKPYIIGAFVLFTGTLIPNIIYKIAQNI